MSYEQCALLQFVQEHAVKRGKVILSSGLVSDYYIDGKAILSSPDGLSLVAEAILDKLDGFKVEAIGGLEVGAISIATAVSMFSRDRQNPLPNFFVRKSPKTHGSMKRIEGFLPIGKAVAVVDDVVTTGNSVLAAVDAVIADGCEVPVAITIVDRDCGARKALESRGIEYLPLITIQDLGLSNGSQDSKPVPAHSG